MFVLCGTRQTNKSVCVTMENGFVAAEVGINLAAPNSGLNEHFARKSEPHIHGGLKTSMNVVLRSHARLETWHDCRKFEATRIVEWRQNAIWR